MPVVAAALLVSGAVGNAEPAAARKIGLAEAEALGLSAAGSPSVDAALGRAAEARAGIGAAWAFEDPTISFGTSRYSARRSYGVALAVPPAWESWNASRAARAELHAAEAQVAVTRFDVRAAIDRAWLTLWAEEEATVVSGATLDDATRLHEATKERLAAGETSRRDLAQVRAALARAKADAAEAEARRAGAADALSTLLGLEAAADLATDDALPARTAALPSEPDVRSALASSAAREAETQGVKAARMRARAARAGWFPRLGVEVTRDEGDPGLPAADLTIVGTAQVPLGFGHGPAVRAASAAARRVAAEAEVSSRQRTASALTSLHAAEGARARLAALDEDGVPAAREAADMAEEAYRAGEIGLFEVLSAKQVWRDASLERIQAAAESAMAEIDLARAMEKK